MLTLKTAKHIRTSQNIKTINSIKHAKQTEINPEEKRLKETQKHHFRLNKEWFENCKRVKEV